MRSAAPCHAVHAVLASLRTPSNATHNHSPAAALRRRASLLIPHYLPGKPSALEGQPASFRPAPLPPAGLPAAVFAPWVDRLVAEHERQQVVAAVAPPEEAAAAGPGTTSGSSGSLSSGDGNGSSKGSAEEEPEAVPLPPPQVRCRAT